MSADFANFFRLGPSPFFILNIAGEIVSANQAAAQLLGRNAAQLQSVHFASFLPDGEAAAFAVFLTEVFASDDRRTCDVTVANADLGRRIIKIDAARDSQNSICYTVAEDVTQHRQGEAGYARLQRHVRQWPAVVYTCKASGDFGATFVSEQVLAQTGYQASQFTDEPSFWKNHVHPEDWPGVKSELPNLFKLGWHRLEYRFLHKDGTYRWMLDEPHLVRDAQGEITEIVGHWLDITERKNAEVAALDVSRRLEALSRTQRAVLDALPAHIALVDQDSVILLVNEAWRRFARANVLFMPDFGVGSNYLKLCERATGTEAEESREWVEGIRSVLSGERSEYSHEYPCHSPTKRQWYRMMITAVEGDHQIRAVIMHVNITDRMLNFEAIQQSEARLQATLDAIPSPIFTYNSQDEFTYLNPAFTKTIGYTLDEIPRLNDWFDKAYPDPEYRRSLLVARQELHDKAQRDGVFEPFDVKVRCKDGADRIMQITSTVGGKSFGDLRIVTFFDITWRTNVELHLRLLESTIAHVNDIVVITEVSPTNPTSTPIVFVNDAFERITGYSRDQVLGKPLRILQGIETDKAEIERIRESLKNKKPIRSELLNYTKAGKPFWLEIDISPLTDTEGNVTHWVAIEREVTERRKALEEDRKRQAELAHLSRVGTMGQMATGLAHELNQPLGAIINYASAVKALLEQGKLTTAKNLEGLDLIIGQADRAGEIIRRLRSFVMKKEPKRAHMQINQIIKGSVDLLNYELRAGNIRVDLKLSPSLPTAFIDQVQTEQVLINLMRNAAAAMNSPASSGRQLTVSSTVRNGYIHVDIADQGCGIPDDDIEKAFEAFFTTKPEGLGMGLVISRSLMETIGGKLSASKNASGGMTFTISIPVQ